MDTAVRWARDSVIQKGGFEKNSLAALVAIATDEAGGRPPGRAPLPPPGLLVACDRQRQEPVLDALGLARRPAFDEVGFTRPQAVDLIRAGRHAGSLVSPRTAKEYGIESNGANEAEAMQAMDLAPGRLPRAGALSALDTGVYVGNFHYLNWSDRSAARITGMTRFATYWVERGEIVAPLAVMRFDDSLYRMLGTELEALDVEADWGEAVEY